MPSNVTNETTGNGQVHTHENDKTDDPAHSVQQARVDDVTSLLILNQHGVNSHADVPGVRSHRNANDDGTHSVEQDQVGDTRILIVQNNGGSNIVVHTPEGTTHINTIHDGWI